MVFPSLFATIPVLTGMNEREAVEKAESLRSDLHLKRAVYRVNRGFSNLVPSGRGVADQSILLMTVLQCVSAHARSLSLSLRFPTDEEEVNTRISHSESFPRRAKARARAFARFSTTLNSAANALIRRSNIELCDIKC